MTSGIPTYSEAPRFMRAQAENRFRHFTPEQLVAYAYPDAGQPATHEHGLFLLEHQLRAGRDDRGQGRGES